MSVVDRYLDSPSRKKGARFGANDSYSEGSGKWLAEVVPRAGGKGDTQRKVTSLVLPVQCNAGVMRPAAARKRTELCAYACIHSYVILTASRHDAHEPSKV